MKPVPTKLSDMLAQMNECCARDGKARDHPEEVEHLEVTPRARRLEAQIWHLRSRTRLDRRAEDHTATSWSAYLKRSSGLFCVKNENAWPRPWKNDVPIAP